MTHDASRKKPPAEATRNGAPVAAPWLDMPPRGAYPWCRDVRPALPARFRLRLLYVRKGRRRAGGDRVAADAGRDGPGPFEQRSRGLFILGCGPGGAPG